jgi:hypothetical protein
MDVGKDGSDIFNRVWRFDFSAPGFCLIDLGSGIDSKTVRFSMVAIKTKLSRILARCGKRFVYRSMGRFDQQVTTKFHLDGAPAESLLMLGYEPSNVRSRVFLADYIRCALDLGMTPDQFMNDLNPMFHPGEEALAAYATEVPEPKNGHSRILLVNNSLLPFTNERTNPLGVMHKAVIVAPDPSERRIVNSVMLTTADVSDADRIGEEQEADFLTTEYVSSSVYAATAPSR